MVHIPLAKAPGHIYPVLPKVLVKPKIGNPSCATKLKEEIIRNSIDSAIVGTQHPRTSVNVIVQEVQVVTEGSEWGKAFLKNARDA